MEFNNYIRNLNNMGYTILPIDKQKKKMKFIKGILEEYKNYNDDKCKELIKNSYFINNDVAIMLDSRVCVIDIDSDTLTSAEIMLSKIILKFPELKSFPLEKTRNGYHLYGKNTNEFKRSIKCIKASFLDINFDEERYNMLSNDDKTKIKFINNEYILPIDYLTTFEKTNGYCRCYPSTNITIINKMVSINELSYFPDELLKNIYNGSKIKVEKLKLTKQETISISSLLSSNIPFEYDEDIINKCKKSIKYLSGDRYNHYDDFIKLAICLSNISHELYGEFNKYNKKYYASYDEEYTYNSFYNISSNEYTNKNKLGLATLIYWLKMDNIDMYNKIWTNICINENSDHIKSLIDEITDININNHYDENGYLKEIPNKPFIAVKSPLGSGKTHQLKNYIKNYITTTEKILFIVGRCSLGYEINYKTLYDMEFEYYKDTTDITKCNRLVIQIDSLFKLYDSHHNIIPYSCIILDEVELLSDRLCEISKENKNDCFNYINWSVKNSKKVILLDGMLTKKTLIIYEKMRGSKACVINNSFVRNNKIINNIYTGRDDKIKITQEIINDAKNNKKLYIVCNEKSTADILHEKLKDININSYCFTSDLDDDLKKHLCMNLDEIACSYQVFITTSVLLAGNSIDDIWFDKCYVLISNKTNNPQQIHQMIKRVRNLKDNKIITCFYNMNEYEKNYSYDNIKEWLLRSNEFMNNPLDWHLHYKYNEHGIKFIENNYIFDFFIRYKFLEKNKQSYISWYIALCNKNNYKVEYCNFQDKHALSTTEEILYETNTIIKLKEEMKEIKQELLINRSDEIADAEIISDSEFELLKKKETVLHEKILMRKYIIAKTYNNIAEEDHKDTLFNSDWILKFGTDKKLQQYKFIKNVNYSVKEFDDAIKNDCIIADNYMDLKDHQKYIIPLNDILKLFGYKNYADIYNIKTGIEIKKNFELNKTKIIEYYNALLYKKECKSKNKNDYRLQDLFMGLNNIIEDLTGSSIKKINEKKTRGFEYNEYIYKNCFNLQIPYKINKGCVIEYENEYLLESDDDEQ